MKKILLALIIALLPAISMNAQLLNKVKNKTKEIGKDDKKEEKKEEEKKPIEKKQETATTTEKKTKEPLDNTPVNIDQLSTKELGNGEYFSSQKGVKIIEITNWKEAAPFNYKKRWEKGSPSDGTYKKSYFTENLFYNPYKSDFIYVYTEKGVLVDFSTEELKTDDKAYKITSLNVLSKDEKVKNVDPEVCREKIVAMLAEQKQKKEADKQKEAKQKLESTNLPKAGMTNVALQNKILAELKKVSIEKKWGDDFKKVIITSTDWYIVRNNLTSVIIKRSIDVVATMTNEKVSPGKCFFVEHKFSQQHTGTGYSETLTYEGIGGTYEILCDKIK